MQTLSKSQKVQLEKALERLRQEKPLVRATEDVNVWLVRSSDKTHFYTVTYSKGQRPGSLQASCTCPAGSKNKICKHAIAPYLLYSQIIRERAATKAAQTTQETLEKFADLFPAPVAPTAPAATPTGGSNDSSNCVICGESWPGSQLSQRAVCPTCELNS